MTTTKPSAPHQILDPSLLGRPVHLLHLFAAQLRDDLSQAMRLVMNRRYWGGFQVEDVECSRTDSADEAGRWLTYDAPSGVIGFSLERKVLLSVLNFRYGRNKSDATGAVDAAAVRVTATEERLAVVLGQQLAATLAARIALNLPGGADAVKAPGAAADFKTAIGSPPLKGGWLVCVTLTDIDSGSPGKFWFALDKQLMAAVLSGLLRGRAQAKKPSRGLGPLAQRLQVALNGRLITKEVPLGSLFDLQVGDIIPISLHRADVLLEESRLFTAAVSEHKGKLCLTSFEDAE
ncbi:FliM/FliN family flagellar motor switch protein [Rugamonas sp.]|uniref:FliM/FliN family flagellar motor switch protein n=1 Tax=Rugamonas sp. TaxID=1926287 RepID=UPI0025EBAB5B|nr:FliM/FliN family flagellar motor switch protein [Rugamonas sp.]